jgi:hypothetical protein
MESVTVTVSPGWTHSEPELSSKLRSAAPADAVRPTRLIAATADTYALILISGLFLTCVSRFSLDDPISTLGNESGSP